MHKNVFDISGGLSYVNFATTATKDGRYVSLRFNMFPVFIYHVLMCFRRVWISRFLKIFFNDVCS